MAGKEKAMATGRRPLEFAAAVAAAAEKTWRDGSMAEAVTPVTRELLSWWFAEPFTHRALNFHEGQRRAILDAIWLHEVAGARNVREAWERAAPELLEGEAGEAVAAELAKGKYGYPKYLAKMATGTGKTWVMHALLIWQYLNARAEGGGGNGRFTRHFLVVAPGLIVYERLLDAFCGRRTGNGEARDFGTGDIKAGEALFVPPAHRDAVYGFLRNSLVRKEEFGRKVTGDGVLAIMNWHAFLAEAGGEASGGEGAGEAGGADDDGKGILEDLLPARPGVAAGNALAALDAAFLRGGRLAFLERLPDLMLVNDEAHHLYGPDATDENVAVWQRGIDALARGKRFFMQLDFTATPYRASGAGKKRREDHFPHVVADFDLPSAIRAGLVKTIVIDQRKDFTGQLVKLDYNAVRDGRRVVALSAGQRLMLRAGLAKLRYLEGEFARIDPAKKPKMMVVCEDTGVTPFVEEFLRGEGLAEDDILTVDSNRQGEVTEAEWASLKGRLFDMDRHAKPRVVVSVLMLREGFDVNNICVIVPLRATNAQILLEQTLGRGVRLMWRGEEYRATKELARRQLLVEKTPPCAVLDFLYVIEHPAFADFYRSRIEEELVGIATGPDVAGGGIADLVRAELKPDWEKRDLFWPQILRESEELLPDGELPDAGLEPFTTYPLAKLREAFARPGEVFVGREMLVRTAFGEYRVHADLFDAKSYNGYLQGVVDAIARRFVRVGGKATRAMPALQVNLAQIAGAIDRFIRNGLFGEPFDPFRGSDWKILLCLNGIVTNHVVEQIGRLVYRIETGAVKSRALVRKIPFSSVAGFVVRRENALRLAKTIYTLTAFPAHGGGLERDFMVFLDRDGGVERFVKINEAKHTFARIAYLRADGLLGEYIPDFLVATADRMWLVETKAEKDRLDANVQAKRQAALEWCRAVNGLAPEDRMERRWGYLLVTDRDFAACVRGNGTFGDLCALAEITEAGLKGEFEFVFDNPPPAGENPAKAEGDPPMKPKRKTDAATPSRTPYEYRTLEEGAYPVLSIRAEYAEEIVLGTKREEYRSWKPRQLGPIALHACGQESFPRAPAGHILGIMDIVAVEGDDGDYAWVIGSYTPLEKPVRTRGFQGIWPSPMPLVPKKQPAWAIKSF